MASTTPFLEAVKARRSIYSLSAESPIPDSKIHDLVNFAITNLPSTYNVQSARAVLLLNEQHKKLWDIIEKHVKTVVPEETWKAALQPRISGHRAAYGTVMWFEDDAALDKLKKKNPMVGSMLAEFSDHSTGMHQFFLWTALEAEGFGANLQHFTFLPVISQEVLQTWDLPETWKLKAQLVFGKPTGGPDEKTFEPLDQRVKVFS